MSKLANFLDSHQFEIGDGVILGEREYGGKARQAIARIGYRSVSLANIERVCRAIPPDERNPRLKYSLHVVVYKLPKEKRRAWLERAESEGWTVREFRDNVYGPPGARGRRKFGPRLDFRGLFHEPINEAGVVFLFGMVAKDLGFQVEAVTTGYPDCMGKRETGRGILEEVKIEFEFKASNFKRHSHDPKYCDVIVCWENDWRGSCPLEIIELKAKIKQLPA